MTTTAREAAVTVDDPEVRVVTGRIEELTDEIEALREQVAERVRDREVELLNLWDRIGRDTPVGYTYRRVEQLLRGRMGESNIRRVVERGPR